MPKSRVQRIEEFMAERQAVQAPDVSQPGEPFKPDWNMVMLEAALTGGLGTLGRGIPLAARLGRSVVYSGLGALASLLSQGTAHAVSPYVGPMGQQLARDVTALAYPPLLASLVPSKLMPGAAAMSAARQTLAKREAETAFKADLLEGAIDTNDLETAAKLLGSEPASKLADSGIAQFAVGIAAPPDTLLKGSAKHVFRRMGTEYVTKSRELQNAFAVAWEDARNALRDLSTREAEIASRMTEYISQKTGMLNLEKLPDWMKEYVGTKVEDAAHRMVRAYKTIGERLVAEGILDPAQLKEYYHPHLLLPEVLKQALEGTGLEKHTLETLKRELGLWYRSTTPSFTKERKIEKLLKDWHNLNQEVAAAAYQRALDTAALRYAYGKGFKRLYALRDALKAAGRANEADVVNQVLGAITRVGTTLPEPVRRGMSEVRALVSAIYLPLATLSNATQVTQNLVVSSARGLVKQLKNVDYDVLKAIAPSAMQSLRDIVMETTLAGRGPMQRLAGVTLTASGFLPVEVMNRVASNVAGMAFLYDAADRAMLGKVKPIELKKLSEWGVNVTGILKNGRRAITNEDLKRAAIGMERWTQFGSKPHEIPVSWHSPWAKWVTQFKQYAMAQARLVGELGRESLREFFYTGDLRALAPLAKLGILTPTLGLMVKELRDKITGQQRELKAGDSLDAFLKLSQYALGAGIALEAVHSLADPQEAEMSTYIPVAKAVTDAIKFGHTVKRNVTLWDDDLIQAIRYARPGRFPIAAPFQRFMDPGMVYEARRRAQIKETE